MDYNILKSLHIIFVVTWFAGLFYIFRLFVYHAEALKMEEPQQSILAAQYKIMERRLWYIITWPSCFLTLLFGIWLLVKMPVYLSQPWMHLKLFFIFCLLLYQWKGQRIYSSIINGKFEESSIRMRFWNEVGTLLLVAIVFIVVNKDSISWIWGALSLLSLGVGMTVVIKGYQKIRTQKKLKE